MATNEGGNQSYQDFDVTCKIFKVGYNFMENHNPHFYKLKEAVDKDDRIKFAVQQQIMSTVFNNHLKANPNLGTEIEPEQLGKLMTMNAGEDGQINSGQGTADNSSAGSIDFDEKKLDEIQQESERRVSDFIGDAFQMSAVKLLLNQQGEIKDEHKKMKKEQLSKTFTLDFIQKMDEIRDDNDLPLHEYKENIRFFQDQESNVFLPRLAHLSINIQEKFAEVPQGESAENEIFSSNFINLSQFIRKKEMPSDVPVGEPDFVEQTEEKHDETSAVNIIAAAADILNKSHSSNSSKHSQNSNQAVVETTNMTEEIHDYQNQQVEEAVVQEQNASDNILGDVHNSVEDAVAVDAVEEATYENNNNAVEDQQYEAEAAVDDEVANDVMADIDAVADNAAEVAVDMAAEQVEGAETNADQTNNFEGGGLDDSFEAAPKNRGEKIRLYFRRDHRCELDLPYNMDTVSYIYVDIDFEFVRTASKQFTKYEPLLQGKKEDEVTNKQVQMQIMTEIIKRDTDLSKLTQAQQLLILKKDRKVRRRVLKIAAIRLGGYIILSSALKEIGIEMSPKELENEETEEYKDAPEYKDIKRQQYDRDRVIDSLMMQQASLATIKEKLTYDIIKQKIDQKLIEEDQLTDIERQIYEEYEADLKEKHREEEFEREQQEKRYMDWLQENLENEFDQYSYTFLY